jgi:hypothetical protein
LSPIAVNLSVLTGGGGVLSDALCKLGDGFSATGDGDGDNAEDDDDPPKLV